MFLSDSSCQISVFNVRESLSNMAPGDPQGLVVLGNVLEQSNLLTLSVCRIISRISIILLSNRYAIIFIIISQWL